MQIVDYVDPNEFDTLLNDIDSCVGLAELKKYVHKCILEFKKNNDYLSKPYRIILSGPLATGKSYLIEKIGRLFKAMGAIKGPIVGPEGAGYLGAIERLAIDLEKNASKLHGGLIIIDDFNNNSSVELYKGFSLKITELLKNLKDLSIIIAVNDSQLTNMLELDPFYGEMKLLNIKGYNTDELIEILKNKCTSMDYTLDKAAIDYLKEKIAEESKRAGNNFSNIRYIYQLFEIAQRNQSTRLLENYKIEKLSRNALMCITLDDIKAAFE